MRILKFNMNINFNKIDKYSAFLIITYIGLIFYKFTFSKTFLTE
jgi:hypothetical protein